jgi:hypothetical protein
MERSDRDRDDDVGNVDLANIEEDLPGSDDALGGAGAIVGGGVAGTNIGPGGMVGSAGAAVGGGLLANDLVNERDTQDHPDSESSPDSFAGSGPENPDR